VDDLGLKCPKCHCRLLNQQGRAVYYTRRGKRCIVRRRVCNHCGCRFSTVERVALEGENFGAGSTGGTV